MPSRVVSSAGWGCGASLISPVTNATRALDIFSCDRGAPPRLSSAGHNHYAGVTSPSASCVAAE